MADDFDIPETVIDGICLKVEPVKKSGMWMLATCVTADFKMIGQL